MKLHKLNKLGKTAAYNTHSGAWVLTTRNRGPIEIVIEVRGERELAYQYAQRIARTFNKGLRS